jgi:hypothetical protein
MAADDDKALLPGASQAARGILPAIPLQGDSAYLDRRGIDFKPMTPGISLGNLKNKVCRPENPFRLTPAARGHNISMDRGFYFFRPN